MANINNMEITITCAVKSELGQGGNTFLFVIPSLPSSARAAGGIHTRWGLECGRTFIHLPPREQYPTEQPSMRR